MSPSSYASSLSSEEGTLYHYHTASGGTVTPGVTAVAAKIKSMAQKGRPQIKISLNGYEDSWIATYSTMDTIEGIVSITCAHTTAIEKLAIEFQGNTRTFLERMNSGTTINGRSEAKHQFLKLTQPISESALPAQRVMEAGKTYDFHFVFNVPNELLPKICKHTTASSAVQHEHLKLPPSFGDKGVAGRGQTLLDDIAPEMARIRYCVAVILQEKPKVEGHPIAPIEVIKKVRVLPVLHENPPIDTEGEQSDYVLRREKDMRKGVFKPKTGRLVVESSQPKSMVIPSHRSDQQVPEDVLVKVNLRFDPVEEKGTPPKLGALSTKLKVMTFFSVSARARLPTKVDTTWDMGQGLHSESINLASRCVGAVDWAWNDADASGDERRRSSVLSTSSDIHVPEPSKKYKGHGFWTAQLKVPISLPANKVWIPTFHNCLVSRSYMVYVHLGVSAGSMSSGVDLKLPIQLTSSGHPGESSDVRAASPVQDEAAEEMEINEFFAGRSLSRDDTSRVGQSNILPAMPTDLPPAYQPFPQNTNRSIAVV